MPWKTDSCDLTYLLFQSRWSVPLVKQRGTIGPPAQISSALSDAKPYVCGFPHLYGSALVVLSSSIIASQCFCDTNANVLPSSAENGFLHSNHTQLLPARMSSNIDTELATLHARIAQLEEAKKVPPPPKPTLEELISDRRHQLEQYYGTKYDTQKTANMIRRSEVQMLESILESLNRIHARLDALESR